MRVVGVLTNETCNLQCSFCDARRPHERASVASASAIRQRIDDAASPETIVLTGGEPTLREDLPAVIRYARTAAPRVVLETNGTHIDAARAAAWAAAGLSVARLHVPATGAELDTQTGGTDVWAGLLSGARALQAANIELEVTVPIVAANLDAVGSIPEALGAAGLTIARLWIRVPVRAPDPGALASREGISAAVQRLAAACRHHRLDAAFDPATFIPPCQLARPAKHAYLYALTAGGAQRTGYRRPVQCQSCAVRDRCPGLPQDAVAFADATVRPIADDRTRRRLIRIVSDRAQADRELVTRELYRRPDGSAAAAHVIRINFRCNQACRFCFVSTHLPNADDNTIRAAIETAAAQSAIVVLSGGEPTLNPRLPDWAALAKDGGAPEVELQTNATRLAEPCRRGTQAPRALAAVLDEAGVDIAFVSLHAATAECSDALTGTPGTFAQTLAGLDALARTSIRVRINFVLSKTNAAQFPAFVTMVATRWPAAAVTVSFVGTSTDLVPRTPDLIPRYTDVLPYVREGLALAQRGGLEVDGFDSMCGIPLCLAPVDPRRYLGLSEPPPGYDGGELMHPPPCDGCALRRRCFGLRRGYAALYGYGELRPIALERDDTD